MSGSQSGNRESLFLAKNATGLVARLAKHRWGRDESSLKIWDASGTRTFAQSANERGTPNLASLGALQPIPPVPWPTATVSYRKNYDFRRKILINDAEGKLSESISSEIFQVDGPAMGSFSDSFYGLLKDALKVHRSNKAAVSIPSQ